MITKTFKILALVSLFCLVAFFSQTALAWDTPPSGVGAPPACDTNRYLADGVTLNPSYRDGCNPPINAGATDQTKAGGLTINKALTVKGATTLNSRVDFKSNPYFYYNVFFMDKKSAVFYAGAYGSASGTIYADPAYLSINGIGAPNRLVKVRDNLDATGSVTAQRFCLGSDTPANCLTKWPTAGTAGDSYWKEVVKNSEIVYNGDRLGVGPNVDNPTSGVTLAIGANNTGIRASSTFYVVVGGSDRMSIDESGNTTFERQANLKGGVTLGANSYVPGNKNIRFGGVVSTGLVGMNAFTSGTDTTLDIVGGGTAPNRKVKVWDNLLVSNLCTADGGVCKSITNIINNNNNLWATSGADVYNTNTGKVGIGTSKPLTDLAVSGTGGFSNGIVTLGTSLLMGNVGIMTPAGSYALNVYGKAKVSGDVNVVGGVSADSLAFSGVAPGTTTKTLYAVPDSGSLGSSKLYFEGKPIGGDSSWTANGTNIQNSNTGNVGIGSIVALNGTTNTNPGLKLEVSGTNGAPATSGTAQKGSLRLSSDNSHAVLDMGVGNLNTGATDPKAGWLQVTNKSGLNAVHPLFLNPNGGSVVAGDLISNSLTLSGAIPANISNALYSKETGTVGRTVAQTKSVTSCDQISQIFEQYNGGVWDKTWLSSDVLIDLPSCNTWAAPYVQGWTRSVVIPATEGTSLTHTLYFDGKPVGDNSWTTSGNDIRNSNTGNVFIGGAPIMNDQKFVVKGGNIGIETSGNGGDRRGLVFKNADTGGLSTIFTGGTLGSDLGLYIGGDAASNLTMQIGEGKVSIPSSKNNSLVVGDAGSFGTDEVGVFTTKTSLSGVWAASITSANANARGLKVYNKGGTIGDTAFQVSLASPSGGGEFPALTVDGKGSVAIPSWLFAGKAVINGLDFDNNSIYFDGGFGARINATAIGNSQALRFYEGSTPREQYGMMLDHDPVSGRSRLLVEKICNYDGSKCIDINNIVGTTGATPPGTPPAVAPAPYFSINGIPSTQTYVDLDNPDVGYNIKVYHSVDGCQVVLNDKIIQTLIGGDTFVTGFADNISGFPNTPYFPRLRGTNEDTVTLNCSGYAPQTMYVNLRPRIKEGSFSVVRDGSNLVYQWSTDSGVKSGAKKSNPDYTLTCKVDPLSVTYYENNGVSAQNNTPVELSNDGYSSKANVCKSNNILVSQKCVTDATISCWSNNTNHSLMSAPVRAFFDQTY